MLIYKGGAFLPGVPARDLSDEEAREYGERRLVESGLYEKPEVKRTVKQSGGIGDGRNQSS